MNAKRLIGNLGAMIALVLLMAAVFVPACLAQSVVSSPDFITDLVTGRNKTGPYMLSYTGFDPGTVAVVVNGRSLRKNAEFQVDGDKGILTFNSVFVNDAIARVSYKLVPGKSNKAAGVMSVPVSLDLVTGPGTTLKVMGVYTADDAKNPDAGRTVLGLGSENKWKNTTFTSQFFVSRKDDPNGESSGGKDTAYRVGAETTQGQVKLSATMLRSQDNFNGLKEYGIAGGKSADTFSLTFDPSKQVQAVASFSQFKDSTGATSGNYGSQKSAGVVYNPSDATRVAVGMVENVSGNSASGAETTTQTNTVKVDQKLGVVGAASASVENTKVTTGSGTENIEVNRLDVAGAAGKNVTVAASAMTRNSDVSGEETSTSVSASAKPMENAGLNVKYATLENSALGKQDTTDVSVAVAPIKQVNIQASLTDTNVEKGSDTSKTTVAVVANPMANVEVKGKLVQDTVDSANTVQKDVSVAASPANFVKVTGNMSQKDSTATDVSRGATVEMRAGLGTTVAAGYKETKTGEELTVVKDYSASTQPLTGVNLSGQLRNRNSRSKEDVDTHRVNVAVAPAKTFVIESEYQYNPEDDKGNVQSLKNESLGARWKLGSVGLSGKYTRSEQYLANRFSEAQTYGVELPVSRVGTLTTGVVLNRMMDAADDATRMYTLGYRHDVGEALRLSLAGSLKQQYSNGTHVSEDEQRWDLSLSSAF